MITYSAVLPAGVFEVNGSRSETFAQFDFTARAEFTCSWEDRFAKADALMGTIYNYPAREGSDGFYSRYYPAQVTNVSVNTWGAEGITTSTVTPPVWQPYTLAHLQVDYKALARPSNWNIQETVVPTLSMRQLPSWGFYWRSDGSPVLDTESPALMQVQAKITRHINGIRKIPEWFYTLAGGVNENSWTDSVTNISYLPGTLLFNPSNMDRTITLARGDDDNIWNIAFDLSWNPIGWNNFQRPHGVDMMMYDEAPVYLYPTYTFPRLLLSDYDDESLVDYVGEPYQITIQGLAASQTQSYIVYPNNTVVKI